jgi:peptide/nickel transport system ATP-binding protein
MSPANGPAPIASAPLLRLAHLEKRFELKADWFNRALGAVRRRPTKVSVSAVTDVTLDARQNEILGLVGESGCGKSTLGRMVTGVLSPTAGDIIYKGHDVRGMTPGQRRDYDLGVQMIFQNPQASLNPRMKVIDIIGEAPVVHGLVTRKERDEYVATLMAQVGLDPSYRFRYPHQFSGGQRQRIGIARALALKPTVLVCDESTAALDVSIQAQVLNLFEELREQFHLTYVFISHNLGVISHIADRVAIMYLGRIVEIASADVIFTRPNHPYTQGLMASLPELSTERREFSAIQGELPSPLNPPQGCAFHPRCPYAMPRCHTEVPALKVLGQAADASHAGLGAHLSACHLNDLVAAPQPAYVDD